MKKIFICCFALVATTNYSQGMIKPNGSTHEKTTSKAVVRDRSDIEERTNTAGPVKRPRSTSVPTTADSVKIEDDIVHAAKVGILTREMKELNLDSNKNNEQSSPDPKN